MVYTVITKYRINEKRMGSSKDRSSYSSIYAYSLPRKNSQYASNRSIEKQNIEARLYFSPSCHQQDFFKHYKSTDLTNTNKIAKQIISLPLWEGMTQEIVEQIIMCLMQKVVSTDE